MNPIGLLQDLIFHLDLCLPWLLPTLEAIELAAPTTARLLICVPLLTGVATLRRRSAASAA